MAGALDSKRSSFWQELLAGTSGAAPRLAQPERNKLKARAASVGMRSDA